MGTAKCETCGGRGTVCSKCGKSRKRKTGRWSTNGKGGCVCYGGRIVKCPSHVTTVHTCDVCGVKHEDGKARFLFHHAQGAADALLLCEPCDVVRRTAEVVAFEQVLERRAGTANVVEAAEARVVDVLRAEVLWWRDWCGKILEATEKVAQPLSEGFSLSVNYFEARREGWQRLQRKMADVEAGRIA